MLGVSLKRSGIRVGNFANRRKNKEKNYVDNMKTHDIVTISRRVNLILFNASKTQFLQLSTQNNLPDNYPLFFNDTHTHLPLSSTSNTLDLSFIKNLDWQFHISTLAKSASKKLGVLWHLHPFFIPSQLLALSRGLIRQCMEYGSHVWCG